MRQPWLSMTASLLTGFAGCVSNTAVPPKITGHVKSVSDNDIRLAIALANAEMRYEIGWAVPIDHIEVNDRDHIMVIWVYRHYTNSMPIRRVNGVWVPPPRGVVVDG